VTVERIVDDIRPWSHLVRIPAHRVLAVVECPMGAHPGGCYAGSLPVAGYGEDYEFWVEARAATRSDDYDAWIKRWVLDVESQQQWVDQLGAERVHALRTKAAPDSWRADQTAYPPDLDSPTNGWERAAVWGARYTWPDGSSRSTRRRPRRCRGRGTCRRGSVSNSHATPVPTFS